MPPIPLTPVLPAPAWDVPAPVLFNAWSEYGKGNQPNKHITNNMRLRTRLREVLTR
jgi:hypothetical protein